MLKNIGTIVGILAGGYAIFSFARKSKDRALALAYERAGKNSQGRIAIQLKIAMNPSGVSWLMYTDGTDEESLFSELAKVQDFSKVQSFYRQITGGNALLDDMASELSAEEYKKAMQLIAGNQGAKILKTKAIAPPTLVGKKVIAPAGTELKALPLETAKTETKLIHTAVLPPIERMVKKDGTKYATLTIKTPSAQVPIKRVFIKEDQVRTFKQMP